MRRPWDRLQHASLFSDDITRLASLRTMPIESTLFRPFNEHIAPLFEMASWVTWKFSGDRLVDAPFAFTFSSILAFVLCTCTFGLVIRDETESNTTGLAAVAAFCLSSVNIEAAWWFSASSFTWALLTTLIAWYSIVRYLIGRGSWGWWIASLVASCAAPAFSAIGLLAGPVVSARVLFTQGGGNRWRRILLVAVSPLLGTIIYLGSTEFLRYREVLRESVATNLNLREGFLNTFRAPVRLLIPGIFGMEQPESSFGNVELLVAGVSLLAILRWGRRSPHRTLIYGGLALILSGYFVTYPFRSGTDSRWVLSVQRYHLFPYLGILMLLSAAIAPQLRRFDARANTTLGVATVVAILFAATHYPSLKHAAKFYHFPSQGKTLAALDRLSDACRARGISRDQAMAFLAPIRPSWFPHDSLGIPSLIAPTVFDAYLDRSVTDSLMISTLTPDDREALFGTMDISKALRPSVRWNETISKSSYRLIRIWRLRSSGSPDRYESMSGKSFAEFHLAAQSPLPDLVACRLDLPKVQCKGWMELWWSGADGAWSEIRSVRWKLEPEASDKDWSVNLSALPHWNPKKSCRLRLVFKKNAKVTFKNKLYITCCYNDLAFPLHPDFPFSNFQKQLDNSGSDTAQ